MNTDRIYAERVAGEYAPKKASKVQALKKLDRRAKKPANIFAYTFGTFMTLLLGFGMALSMGALGDAGTEGFVLGIITGIAGMAGIGVNYPIYRVILEKGRQKYAFEIVQLAEEITGNED